MLVCATETKTGSADIEAYANAFGMRLSRRVRRAAQLEERA